MNEKIVCGPWICRMSLDDFYLKADGYLTVLKTRQKSLSSTRKLYRAGKDIHLKQFKRTMNLLHKIGETVQQFCKLLSTTAELPEAVVPLRYVLATTLYDLDEQLNELMTMVVSFRTRYYAYSQKTVRQQQEIQRRLQQLINGCNDVREEYHNLTESLLSKAKITDCIPAMKVVS